MNLLQTKRIIEGNINKVSIDMCNGNNTMEAYWKNVGRFQAHTSDLKLIKELSINDEED